VARDNAVRGLDVGEETPDLTDSQRVVTGIDEPRACHLGTHIVEDDDVDDRSDDSARVVLDHEFAHMAGSGGSRWFEAELADERYVDGDRLADPEWQQAGNPTTGQCIETEAGFFELGRRREELVREALDLRLLAPHDSGAGGLLVSPKAETAARQEQERDQDDEAAALHSRRIGLDPQLFTAPIGAALTRATPAFAAHGRDPLGSVR